MRRFSRFACIDWSGAKGERLKGIAVAECGEGRIAPTPVPPPGGGVRWSRQTVLEWLLARAGDSLLIGVDFSSALPFVDAGAYFRGQPGPALARKLWEAVDDAGGDHLSASGFLADPAVAAHFRIGAVTGAKFESGMRNGRLRRVEEELASGHAASCFNLVGANQVGKSSLSGMRVLHRLGRRVPVWPFDPVPPRGALIVEIYTSIAAACALPRPGRSKITSGEDLDRALTSEPIDSEPYGHVGKMDDHSSDALLTAAWLRRAAGDTAMWRPPPPEIAMAEGWTFGVPYRKEAPGPA